MFKHLVRQRPTPAVALGFVALMFALGGVGYAASGDNMITGGQNAATTATRLSANIPNRTLQLQNTSTGPGASALGLTVAAGKPPMTVNSDVKVARLNADEVDGLDSSEFVRNGVAQSAALTGAGGVVDVTNTGSTNGVQGRTGAATASGVYGENTGSGFGVSGRAGDGIAVYGDNTGGGYAGFFQGRVHVAGKLEIGGTLGCAGCIGAGGISGRVNDSERLDGIDSTGFIRGQGKATAQAVAITPGGSRAVGPQLFEFVQLSYFCPTTLSTPGVLRLTNVSAGVANVFIDDGGTNPVYAQLHSGQARDLITVPTADSFRIQAQGALGILTLDAATVHRASDCHAQAQALFIG
jgi:hypothetical protein